MSEKTKRAIRRASDGAFYAQGIWFDGWDTIPPGADFCIGPPTVDFLNLVAGVDGVIWREGAPWPPERQEASK